MGLRYKKTRYKRERKGIIKKTSLERELRPGSTGMSGDTELFENPSNIKGLWASE